MVTNVIRRRFRFAEQLQQLQQLFDEVGTERSLLALCPAFRGKGEYPKLTVK